MPRLLRIVDGDRWDFSDDLAEWRARGDLPGAAIGDLKPSASGKLSLWVIEDGDSNLNRVIALLAANRNNVESFDARVIDQAAIEALGINPKPSRGQSRDAEANQLWHMDLADLTYRQLFALADPIADTGVPIERDENEVRDLILASVRAGYIKKESLQPPKQSDRAVWKIVTDVLAAETEGQS